MCRSRQLDLSLHLKFYRFGIIYAKEGKFSSVANCVTQVLNQAEPCCPELYAAGRLKAAQGHSVPLQRASEEIRTLWIQLDPA